MQDRARLLGMAACTACKVCASALVAGGLTSKEQKAVRDRISNLKASLQKTIDKHNTVRHLGLERRAQDVQLEQVLQGNFPWAFRGLDPQSSAVQG